MPLLRNALRLCAVLVATAVVGASGTAYASTAAPTSNDVATSLTVTGIVTESNPARLGTLACPPDVVRPDGAGTDCGPRPSWCKQLFSLYKIYIPLGPDLVRWKFSYRWCFIPDQGIVTTFTDGDDLTVLSVTIRVTGALDHRRDIGGRPVVRSLYQGRNFQFCPITNPFGTSCIAEFHPKIDMYFTGGGQYIDLSVISG